MKKSYRGFALYAVIILAIIIISQMFGAMGQTRSVKIDYNKLLEYIEKDEISAVAILDDTLVGLMRTTKIAQMDFPDKAYDFETTIDKDNFFATVRQIYADKLGKPVSQVSELDFAFGITYLPQPQTPWYLEFIPFLIMMALVFVFWMFIMRQQSGGGNKVMSFGRSRARVFDPDKNKITFADVAGADEEKEELAEIVDFLRNPKRFTDLGARIPKGVLLVGPPGTGKTLLAKAVAGEAGVPFLSISGSDFVEMFVGVGASRVRDLFEQAKRHAPSIVFIDEIDAVGRHRGAGMGGGHDEREQTLNQLLVEMDGFSINEGVIVLAATNRRDILDPALLRPGRFDRQITVNYPDVRGREAVLKVHSRGKPLADDVDLSVLAKRTPFFTGADLENIMNEAAILCARAGGTVISMKNLRDAVERVQMGPEKKSHVVTEQDKRLVAYHEAGHAIVGAKLKYCDDVHLVTIVPRGNGAGGYTLSLPVEERDFSTKNALVDFVTMALGGYAAEKLVIGDVSNGATSDLKRSTELCRAMVTQYGMSDKLGPIYLGGEQEVFLARDMSQQTRNYSEELAALIDTEIREQLQNAYYRATDILRENVGKLHGLAELLIEKETVYKAEFEAFMNKEEEA
ncbi:ATP-dependent zinc metalloprotease FtsH [Beduinella massiliensis]|uniref:ATP-dependent zinc metalloprotease FtsH n=1 Tax=Beduinella massiliensis TaxID=1852363 RepID=UPI0031F821E1